MSKISLLHFHLSLYAYVQVCLDIYIYSLFFSASFRKIYQLLPLKRIQNNGREATLFLCDLRTNLLVSRPGTTLDDGGISNKTWVCQR